MSNLKLYYSDSFACGYFDKLKACYLILDPNIKPDIKLQESLATQGYRRSGNNLYYPWCNNCYRCVPIRLRVADFKYSNSQKRCLKKNQQTKVRPTMPKITEQVFELYKKYQQWKHPGAGMDECDNASSMNFLLAPWANTKFNKFFVDNKLVAVSVTDIFKNSMSAVYTFYDKNHADLSLGTYAMLWQIEYAKKLEFDYLYLGYYIKDSKKMSYKSNFKPHEFLLDGLWFQN